MLFVRLPKNIIFISTWQAVYAINPLMLKSTLAEIVFNSHYLTLVSKKDLHSILQEYSELPENSLIRNLWFDFALEARKH